MILVSACLLGENCKYNGGNNKNEKVIDYLKDKSYIAVCPELLGGLPCPRTPSEIKDGRVYFKDGTEVTKEFKAGAEKVVELIKEYDIEEAILKDGSPSCGSKLIYDGTFNSNKIKGMGITAKALKNFKILITTEDDFENEL